MISKSGDRLAWALLARAASGPSAPLLDLVDSRGVSEAAAAVGSGGAGLDLDPAVLSRGASIATAVRDLDEADYHGFRLVTRDDAEWPRELLACLPTGSGNPGDAAPLALWVRGPHSLREVTRRAMTVTGARASTDYGAHVTRSFATELTAAGWTVTSGAAFGIDATAHEAALSARGMTVAIVPCGLDRAYPIGNQPLLAEIAERGLIVSEYPPGARPHRHAFLDRNRLLAALSAATVAVEMGVRSGTASTIRWAARFERPVFAVPGPVTSEASRGCHQFIADRSAQLVTCARDAVEALAKTGDDGTLLSPDVIRPEPGGMQVPSVGAALLMSNPSLTFPPVEVVSSGDERFDSVSSGASQDGHYPVWSETGEVRDHVERLVSLMVEAFNHRRTVDQFETLLAPKVFAALGTRARSAQGQHRLATLHTCRPTDDVVEFCATVWVSSSAHSLRALALAGRMEHRADRWICTVLRPPGVYRQRTVDPHVDAS